MLICLFWMNEMAVNGQPSLSQARGSVGGRVDNNTTKIKTNFCHFLPKIRKFIQQNKPDSEVYYYQVVWRVFRSYLNGNRIVPNENDEYPATTEAILDQVVNFIASLKLLITVSNFKRETQTNEEIEETKTNMLPYVEQWNNETINIQEERTRLPVSRIITLLPWMRSTIFSMNNNNQTSIRFNAIIEQLNDVFDEYLSWAKPYTHTSQTQSRLLFRYHESRIRLTEFGKNAKILIYFATVYWCKISNYKYLRPRMFIQGTYKVKLLRGGGGHVQNRSMLSYHHLLPLPIIPLQLRPPQSSSSSSYRSNTDSNDDDM